MIVMLPHSLSTFFVCFVCWSLCYNQAPKKGRKRNFLLGYIVMAVIRDRSYNTQYIYKYKDRAGPPIPPPFSIFVAPKRRD